MQHGYRQFKEGMRMHLASLKCIEFAQRHWFRWGQNGIHFSLKEELAPLANVIVANGAEDESWEAARVSSAASERTEFISCSVRFERRKGVGWYVQIVKAETALLVEEGG